MKKKIVVTGAAGFIGSHVCDSLLAKGYAVVGVDCLIPNYDLWFKHQNLGALNGKAGFEFLEVSLNDADLDRILDGVDCVMHLAAQAGVRDSWQSRFDEYVDANIRATQRLCESARDKSIRRFVYASSSSVYGETEVLPMAEDHPTRPVSPYGVTKQSGEALCLLYRSNFGLPVVALRFFTVYGPRQRPDMAFHRFIQAALEARPIEVFGTGEQTRDFTFVSDIVEGCMLAMEYRGDKSVFNLGGGSRITLNRALDVIADLLPGGLDARYQDMAKGDVSHTYADISLARTELGYEPKMTIEEGMEREVVWLREALKRRAED